MSRFVRSFRELEVYQASLALAGEIHEFCSQLPPIERFALADQMRRASRSVCSNLSEAWRKRRYQPAFLAKINDAESEAAEMQAWFDIARQLGYLLPKQYIDWDARYENIIGQLVGMIKTSDRWCSLPRQVSDTRHQRAERSKPPNLDTTKRSHPDTPIPPRPDTLGAPP